MHNSSGSLYDIALMQRDMRAKGWLPIDLARKADVSHMSVSRFLSGERQTPRMAKRFAEALGHSLKRYLVEESASREAVAP